MKNLLFVFVSFFCVNCSVFAALPDTIIVNTGQNSKVVFYGKTPAELKKLEKLDLNQLLRRINQKQDSLDQFAPQPNNPNQRIKLDVGDRTLNIKPLTAWQKYKENTFLNFYVGRSVNYEDYTITNPSQETLRNYLGYSNVSPYARASVNLENKISIGISLQHETKIVEIGRAHV